MSNEELVPLDALSGLESAVVRAFLELEPAARESLIQDYRRRYGEAAALWLSRAAELWPVARLGVSRITLARLFAALPDHMDQAKRLQLAESIWHVARAPSQATLRVPPGFRNHGLLRKLVHEHFLGVLPSVVELPEVLQLSVPWLNDPALRAQHQVLNLLLVAERDSLLAMVDEQIEVLFARRLDGLEVRSNFSIAGHQLLLRTDERTDMPQLEHFKTTEERPGRSFNDRAPKIALLGAAIGGVLALLALAIISVI